METLTLRNKSKIIKIIDLSISKKVPIKIHISGTKGTFSSRAIHYYFHDDEGKQVLDVTGLNGRMIIEKLVPESGNRSIQSSHNMIIQIIHGGRLLEFESDFRGLTNTPPYIGLLIDFPKEIIVHEARVYKRTELCQPALFSANISIEKEPGNMETFELKVINYSKYGLRLLISEQEKNLLNILKIDDIVSDITFFSSWAIIKAEGIVKHISRIEEGEFKGYHVLGIESNEIIDSSGNDLE